MAEQFFIFNDKYFPSQTAVLGPSNRGLRYGDGLFETMNYIDGAIINQDFHFERFFNGLSILQFQISATFTADFILKKIRQLCAKNKHSAHARVRLMIVRGDGGIFDPVSMSPNYIIESWELLPGMQLNENGLVIGILPDVRKSCDKLSNLKSNNYLPYIMAGLYAKQQRLNDCIVLNSFDRICDSAIANLFLLKGNRIFTPPLSEGCVAGVMRRWMLEKFIFQDFELIEQPLTAEDLLEADEMFLTNSIHYLRWVESFQDKKYDEKVVTAIYQEICRTIC